MIAIVNPPSPPNTVSIKDTMGGLGQLHPVGFNVKLLPLDNLYAAALLRSRNIPVEVIDCLCSGWDLSALILYLHTRSHKFIALRTSTPSFKWDMDVARILKMVTNAKIIIFGAHVSLFPTQAIHQPFVDAVIVGEAEEALLDIAERETLCECEGVWYKKADGIVVDKGRRRSIENLDNLPAPAWDLVQFQGIDGTAYMRHLKPFVTTLTSRGCPHGCLYCPYPVIQGERIRACSAERVLDELEWLTTKLGVKAILLRDPEFAFQRNRVVKICEGIIKRNIRVAWRCETRMEDIDEELIRLFSRSGCIGINIGIETTNKEVLKNVKRNVFSLRQADKLIKACKRNNIDSFCFFILGLPGETIKSSLKTISSALKLKPTGMEFTIATPYPGTGLRAWAEARGFIEDYSNEALTGYHATMRNDYMACSEILSLQKFANEARNMRLTSMAKRFFGHIYKIGAEARRWGCFQLTKLRLLWK